MEATSRARCFLEVDETPEGDRRKIVANKLRENLKHFVNSETRSAQWQLDYVKSVGETRRDK